MFLSLFSSRRTKYYDQSISREWKPSDEFCAIIDDMRWIGLINFYRWDMLGSSSGAGTSQSPPVDTWFQCFSVTWANGDQELLSPWDLKPIPEEFNWTLCEDGMPVSEEERLAIIDNDWMDTGKQ